MERVVNINCYYRHQEDHTTLRALVEAGFDSNIVTSRGLTTLKSCGHLPENVPGGRPIRGPDGSIYMGRSKVTAFFYPTQDGRRSEEESFYLVDREPPNLRCDLVLGKNSLLGKNLENNSAAPTYIRPRSDAEKQKAQDEEKKKDEQRRAEQEKKREKERRDREAKRGH